VSFIATAVIPIGDNIDAATHTVKIGFHTLERVRYITFAKQVGSRDILTKEHKIQWYAKGVGILRELPLCIIG
jgi:hypothetical protein